MSALRRLARPLALAAVAVSAALTAAGRADAFSTTPVPYQVYNSPKRLNSTVIEDGHYHHAATVAQFNGRVWVAWNGNNYNASEGQPGQVIMLRTSDDGGAKWSSTRIPFVKEYRALDDMTQKGIDAAPGDADDDHKIRLNGARQWQPSLVVFKGRLLMFWGQDRNADGSALMMSELESAGDQWRSSELHFKADGAPYLAPANKGSDKPADPPYLTIQANKVAAGLYPKITGSATLPASLNLKDLPKALLKQEDLTGGGQVTMPVALDGHRLVPAPNQSTVLHDKSGTEVLVVALVLQQTEVDWNNLAVKIPAVLTTTDLVNWQLSIVPLKTGATDFIGDERGDIGLISAWEPTVTEDIRGNFQMEFRLNLPPRTESGVDPRGNGLRSASASGVYAPGVGVQWKQAKLVDYDVPASRATMVRLQQTGRWVLALNHAVQGASYNEQGVPVFRAEKYEPWSRQNVSLLFSTRGQDDFVAGLNISSAAEEPGVEVVHYPYLQSVRGKDADELLAVFSTHRRAAVCRASASGGPVESCHDSIQFVRLRDLPDPKRPAIYPNHFARYQKYGKAKAQDKVYSFANDQLVLHDRASAGIETAGNQGCLALKFKLDGDLRDEESRPVISFGRSPDRTQVIGLSVRRRGGAQQLLLGDKPLAVDVKRGEWVAPSICYDYEQGTLKSGKVEVRGGPGMAPRVYLGDPTLARRDNVLPDLVFDVGAMALDSAADLNATTVPAKSR